MSITVPEAVGAETFTYWAFLSYSHRDRKWGDWLHRALETYPVPKRVVGQPTRDGQRPKRLFPIFRDREELSASADLSTKINEALRRSRYLVVVCSRSSAKSVWVNEEIKFFKKLGREDRVLALIVDGEPNAAEHKPGLKADDECFPEALRYQVASDGELLPVRAEPVAGDAREGKDGKVNAKLKLVAGLLDVSFDSLKQREQERRRRSLIAVASIAGVIAVLMTTLAGYAFFQRQAAKAQARLAENRRLAAQASEKQANDARDQADGLINFMLHDLRDKLQPIGRLDVLDDVAKKAKEYLDKLPKELVTASRLRQQADLLNNLGDVLMAQNKLSEALDAYRRGLTIAKRLAEEDKTNSTAQADLSIIYTKVGDVLKAQGKLAEGLDFYQQSRAIAARLAQQDKTNSSWQQNLSLCYINVGAVLQNQGKLAQALDAYQQSLTIAKGLAEQDKTNTNWQRDLWQSYFRIGAVLEYQDKLAEALDTYQHNVAIAKHLVEQDKTNSNWQHDLSVSYEMIGDVLLDQGKLAQALDAYQQTLAIAKGLAEQDKTNGNWQFALSVCYQRVGDVLQAQGKLPEALDVFQQNLAIVKRLAEQDKTNANWQRDLSTVYQRVGDMLEGQGNFPDALNAYQQSLAIIKRLTEQDKTNSSWRLDLSTSYEKVGNLRLDQGELPEALDAYRNALAVSDILASNEPSNAYFLNDAAWSRYCIAKVLMRFKGGDLEEAKRLVAKGIEIMTRLQQQGELNRAAQDTLNKLNEIANELNLSSR